jgi:hypothetical protein
MEPRADPWAAVEARIAEIGSLAGEGDRYRLVRSGGGPALLDESLALAREARRLYRRRPDDARAIASVAERLGVVAARYGTLIERARTTADYLAAVAAWHAGDAPALARLIPAVFADVAVTAVGGPLHHPVAIMGRENRPIDPATVAAHVSALAEEGLTPAEPGSGTASDAGLRAVLLYTSWATLDTPLALRLPPGRVGLPLFRVGAADEILVYTARVAGDLEVVLAAVAPDQDRWPEVGVDYAAYRDALAIALAAAGHPVTYLDPWCPEPEGR